MSQVKGAPTPADEDDGVTLFHGKHRLGVDGIVSHRT